jgi:hypothetical protein
VIPGWRYEHTLAAAFLGCCAATGSIPGAAWALLTTPRSRKRVT